MDKEVIDTKKCPYCAEEIKSEAIFCKHCKKDLGDSKKEKITKKEDFLTKYENWLHSKYQGRYKVLKKDYDNNIITLEISANYISFNFLIFIILLFLWILPGILYALFSLAKVKKTIIVEFNEEGEIQKTSMNPNELINQYNNEFTKFDDKVQTNVNSLKECRYCKMMIPKNADYCSHCKKRVTTSPGTAFLAIIISLFILGTVISAIVGNDSYTGSSSSEYTDCSYFEKEKVKGYLKAPSTAKIKTCYKNTITGKWDGTVDAQNGFGAMIRSNFICSESEGCIIY